MAPAVALAVGLALAGCASANAKEPAANAADSEVDAIQALLFGTGGEPSADQLETYQADNAAFEERVAHCMAEAGFEYQPVNYDVFTYDEADVDYFSREYAEQNGFGYTTSLEDGYGQANEFVDPNQEYVESLGPAESELYYNTLHGEPTEYEDDAGDTVYESGPGGCQESAQSEETRLMNEFWATSGEEIFELEETAENHPVVQAPLAEWRTCMAENGHNFATPDDFDTVMDPMMNELYESAVYPGNDLTDEEIGAMSEDELNALWSQPPQYDQDLLAEAQAYEIELATTSWDCGMEDLYDAYRQALAELQQTYIEANLAKLSALVGE